jgi:hypothetical protein
LDLMVRALQDLALHEPYRGFSEHSDFLDRNLVGFDTVVRLETLNHVQHVKSLQDFAEHVVLGSRWLKILESQGEDGERRCVGLSGRLPVQIAEEKLPFLYFRLTLLIIFFQWLLIECLQKGQGLFRRPFLDQIDLALLEDSVEVELDR